VGFSEGYKRGTNSYEFMELLSKAVLLQYVVEECIPGSQNAMDSKLDAGTFENEEKQNAY
jgi:hypothetical protein